MRTAGVVLAIALALTVQTVLARFVSGGSVPDLVLVAVIFVALSFGPTAGLLAGTLAGLLQDTVVSTGVIGIGGLAKTLVGFVAGIVGTQFIVTLPMSRMVVFIAASLLHSVVFLGTSQLLGLRELGLTIVPVVAQALANAVIGVVVFEASELLPGAVERRRNATQRGRR